LSLILVFWIYASLAALDLSIRRRRTLSGGHPRARYFFGRAAARYKGGTPDENGLGLRSLRATAGAALDGDSGVSISAEDFDRAAFLTGRPVYVEKLM